MGVLRSASMAAAQSLSPLTLSAEDVARLRPLVFGQKVERRLWLRASIIWHLAEGMAQQEVAELLGVHLRTVGKWRTRFSTQGVSGLHDLPRAGAPSKYTAAQRCEVLAIACDEPRHHGVEANDWTMSTLAQAVKAVVPMSRSSVWRTLQQNALHPHRVQMWLHSIDPNFRAKVNAIVSIYEKPPEDAVVLSIDEKTGIQATERKSPLKRPVPGRPGRFEFEYIRHGTQSLLAAFNIRDGQVSAHCGKTRSADDLVSFMDGVAEQYKDAKRIIVIWDNLNIHHDGAQARWTAFNERHGGKFEFLYTPLHASWVNQVEIFFSIVGRRCLRHGDFRSEQDLKSRLLAFIEYWNRSEGHAFNWTFRGYPMQEATA